MKLELYELALNKTFKCEDLYASSNFILLRPENENSSVDDEYILSWSHIGATLTRIKNGTEISSPHPFLIGVIHLDAKKREAFGTTFHNLIQVN